MSAEVDGMMPCWPWLVFRRPFFGQNPELRWMRRPRCWARGWHEPHHCDVYFEMCVGCGLLLWSRKRHGVPCPFPRDARRAPLRPLAVRAAVGGQQ